MTSEDTQFIFITYGSKLYGTDSPTSDTDNKVVYLPSLDSMLLGQLKKSYKKRFDANGNPLVTIGADGNQTEDHNTPMPDNGTETEYFSIQTFVRDFVMGQTYALEIAHGVISKGHPEPGLTYTSEIEAYLFCAELILKFSNQNVYSMTSFAQKQTLDYVHRAERMAETANVLGKFKIALNAVGDSSKPRLDTHIGEIRLIDIIAKHTGLLIGEIENNGKKFRTLELNGRSYMETTELSHIIKLLEKQMSDYGKRTSETFGKKVEWKSMSHAIRVYEQAIELLDTGKISFPRPNALYIRAVKLGQVPLDNVSQHLKQLDAEVLRKQAESTMRERTEELVAAADQWMLTKLHDLYNLSILNE